MIIYFARHGQTDHNRQGIIQGQLDTPLNATGRAESELLAAHLADVPFTEVWSSSLCRATETAEIVIRHNTNRSLTLQTDPGLMERDLGSLSGHRWARGLTHHNLPADVESRPVFRKRVQEWMAHFLASHADAAGPVLVISHGAYLTALLAVLTGPPFAFSVAPGCDTSAHCLNTCIMRLEVVYDARGKYEGTILGWGEIDHLGDDVIDLRVADDLRKADLRKAS